MIDLPGANKMAEATRLVRAGRLGEATALIQRLLRGEPQPNVPAGHERSNANPRAASAEKDDSWLSRFRIPTRKPTFSLLQTQELLQSKPALHGLLKPVPAIRDIAPEGGQFIEATYSNHAGARAYKLYIPTGYRGQELPLVVMLHGCTQSPDDFAAGTRMNFVAEEQTCFVAYPAQSSKANVAKCWNWFRPGDQRRGQGEPSLIAGITQQIMRDYSVDSRRVYIAGLSAGGAAAAVMGATYPDVYAAVGVHSGLACGIATDVASAFAAMREGDGSASSADTWGISEQAAAVPTIVFHGDQDKTVHPQNGDHVIASQRSPELRKKLVRGEIPGGHAYTRTIHSDASGRAMLEHWEIHGAAHAWSGGSLAGTYTDPQGPDAAREMMRFFLEHRNSRDG
jgi:poly(hydroxyalkanoate) depolymerase family esterase